jgi:hypothetical protein
MAGGLCDSDCRGYYSDPKPGVLWPEEDRCGTCRWCEKRMLTVTDDAVTEGLVCVFPRQNEKPTVVTDNYPACLQWSGRAEGPEETGNDGGDRDNPDGVP